MPNFTQVGGSDAYIPTFDGESTGNLITEFSRNPKSFPLLLYSENRPVTLDRGYYLRIEPQQGARVLFDDGRDFAWPPGSDRPTGTDNQSRFQFASYLTQRRAHSVRLDNRAIGMSAWPVAEVELREKAMQAMTQRTRKVASVLANATWGANGSTVASLTGGGGSWRVATNAQPNLEISLQAAAIQINQATLGTIVPSDLVLVMSPDTATALAQTAEIRAVLSNSVYAYPMLTGTLPGARQRNWALPPMLYDFRVAIENTVLLNTQRGAVTTTYQYAIPKGTAYLLTRRENEMVNPSILKMEESGQPLVEEELKAIPSVSTLVGFLKEDMTTENYVDTWNRVTKISIASDYGYVITNTISGYQFTSCFA